MLDTVGKLSGVLQLCIDNNTPNTPDTREHFTLHTSHYTPSQSKQTHGAQVELNVIVKLMVNRIKMSSRPLSLIITLHSKHVQSIVQRTSDHRRMDAFVQQESPACENYENLLPRASYHQRSECFCLSVFMVPTLSNQKITSPILLDLFLMAFFSGKINKKRTSSHRIARTQRQTRRTWS